MTGSIPASAIVDILPGVVSGGGNALDLNGVILTNDPSIPIGQLKSFANATAVSSWFGPTALEAGLASVYFQGYTNSTALPGNLLFAQYNDAAVSAYLRGGSLSALTLVDLQALSGTLTITFNGTAFTSGTITLSAATSFSDAATIIEAAFTAPTFAVTWDVLRSAFVFTSTATGSTETVTYATGTLSASLYLTQTTGAALSQGADPQTPTGMMDAVVLATRNWAAFMTTFEPVTADKVLFSAWTSAQGNRYKYVGWDTDQTPAGSSDTSSWMYQVKQSAYSGSVGIYQDINHAAFNLGVTASIDFTRTNGRITFAFKSQAGLTPSVTDETTANNLIANGYNFYGDYATANQQFQFYYPGQISGEFMWDDSFCNEIFLNSQLQLAVMVFLQQIPSFPYNKQGYSLLRAACTDPFTQAINFGSARKGVSLSAAQIAAVNNAAGAKIDTILSTRGWYLQILDATSQVRASRGSPPMTAWYMDGGSIQKVVLPSILVQ